MLKSILVTAFISLILVGCGEKKEEKWTGFIYPDKSNTKRNLKSPMTFKSQTECEASSKSQLESLNLGDTGAYKCGLNCSFHTGMKLEICEKMVDPNQKQNP